MTPFYNPLLSVLLRINVSNVIRGGSEVVRDYLADFLSLIISTRADKVFFPPNLLGSLRSCH